MTPSYFADISSAQGFFNAGAYASSGAPLHPAAIMVKATESTDYVNPFHAEAVNGAHAHGLPVFHYHFARPEHGAPTEQARWFLEHALPFHRPGDNLICDIETDTPASGRLWLPAFDDTIARAGHALKVYTFLSYFNEAGGIVPRSGELHIAAWGKRNPGGLRWRLGNARVWAWQYTNGQGFGTGPQGFPGITGRCDASILRPDVARKLKHHKP